jgi:hypothetical protein
MTAQARCDGVNGKREQRETSRPLPQRATTGAALARQLRPVDPIIIDQGSATLRPRYRTAVGLRAGNARAHRDGRTDQREHHHRAAKYDYPDEGNDPDDYCDVIEVAATFSRVTRFGTLPDTASNRVPRPLSLHSEYCCLHSRYWMFTS